MTEPVCSILQAGEPGALQAGGKGFRVGVGRGKTQGDWGEFKPSQWDPRASLAGKHTHQMVPLEEEALDFRNVAGQT